MGTAPALATYRKYRKKIGLIILNMVMPGMSGGQTYDLIRKMDSEVTVILSSGYSIDGEASEIINRGCSGFIQKTFNIEELAEKIYEITGEGPP